MCVLLLLFNVVYRYFWTVVIFRCLFINSIFLFKRQVLFTTFEYAKH